MKVAEGLHERGRLGRLTTLRRGAHRLAAGGWSTAVPARRRRRTTSCGRTASKTPSRRTRIAVPKLRLLLRLLLAHDEVAQRELLFRRQRGELLWRESRDERSPLLRRPRIRVRGRGLRGRVRRVDLLLAITLRGWLREVCRESHEISE